MCSASPATSSRTRSISAMSFAYVSSDPTDFLSRFGSTARSSSPCESRRRPPAQLPTACCSTSSGAVRTSTSRSMPAARSLAAVFGPTPQSASTGCSCRNRSMRSGEMTVNPSGLFQPEAIFARNLFGATPADAVSAVASRILAFSLRATSTPSGSPHAFSVTSRYASSSDSGSTSGVTVRKISKTCRDTSPYLAKFGGRITSSGQSRTARDIGIADRTPNFRAS